MIRGDARVLTANVRGIFERVQVVPTVTRLLSGMPGCFDLPDSSLLKWLKKSYFLLIF